MKTLKVKADPVKPVSSHPYMLVKKYANDRYFRTWKDARAAIVKELSDQRDIFDQFGWADSVRAITTLIDQAERLWPERGALVQGVVDPDTGQKYKAELLKREVL